MRKAYNFTEHAREITKGLDGNPKEGAGFSIAADFEIKGNDIIHSIEAYGGGDCEDRVCISHMLVRTMRLDLRQTEELIRRLLGDCGV